MKSKSERVLMPSETIIVVDDDPLTLQVCCRLLAEDGYQVVPAPDGETALEILSRGEQADMALVDVMMPGMNGIELVQELKSSYRGVKVALMSGYSVDEVNRLIGEDGSNYRIFWKPFQLPVFLQMIRNVLDAPQKEIARSARW
jgi:CheY-like chemotaxis protein